MIEFITIDKINLRPGQYVPPFLELLVAAARRGEPLATHVQSIVASFGFEMFEYGVSSTPQPDSHGVTFLYSTADGSWLRHYDRMGYIEIDPRIFLTCKSAVPMIWDQTTARGIGANVDAFLDDALRHGIGSGLAFMWHGPWDRHMAVMFNSRLRVNDEVRVKSITRNLSDIVMFGHYFHEIFMLPALKLGRHSASATQPLSKRERECLALAAKGLTTKDISGRLDISSRTVQFHFERIRDKLGVANRHEAIARAVQTGVIPGEWTAPLSRPTP
ncbi:MAG: LuxR family transcriptional regulator [Burkholderiales bacterium]|nr:LuxR family transcriptional regulator [Burkholderiales bacterium]